jgi:hypothetical protein
MAALQERIDRLNSLWESTTRRLHQRMSDVTQQMLERGELPPSVARQHDTSGTAIGRRWVMQQGVAYEKAFYAGEDEQVDAFLHRRETLAHVADRTIQAAFN